MSKCQPKTCDQCPMFANSCGQYEECFCQHPIFSKGGSDSWAWRNWYEEKHPDCPLSAHPITIVGE